MPLRRGTPLTFKPATVSDAVDGTNAPPGAMVALTNLVPDPNTENVFVPKPGAFPLTQFLPFNQPGAISALLVVGDVAYGMIASARNPGHDEPFAYNLATGQFLFVQGVTPTNVPTSPPVSPAPWTPPFMAQVGSRVIVTHPGFLGGPGPPGGPPDPKFGWFDISSFKETTLGDVKIGSNKITGNPTVAGVQPGLAVSGVFLPANTTILSTTDFVLETTCESRDGLVVAGIASNSSILPKSTISGPGIKPFTTVVALLGRHEIQISDPGIVTGQQVQLQFVPPPNNPPIPAVRGDVYTPNTLSHVRNIAGVAVGMNVAGKDIPVGAVVASIVPGQFGFNAVMLDQPVIGNGMIADDITFSGSTITLSQNATGNASGATFTFTGGATQSPLWGAGDVNPNPLPSVPVGVAQFFGRAYYALGINGIVFSDSGFPCQASNTGGVVQALTTNDGLPVTAIYPLMLSSPLVTTGVVQALVVFEGVSKMQQITGDAAFNTLNMAPLPVATGALSPLGIFGCEQGTGFISPEGLRFINFNGTVTEPVGDAGAGVRAPFIYSSVPSRICAAAGAHGIRVTTINGLLPATPTPYQEYWHDLGRKSWVGPHTFPVSLIQPWQQTFVVTSGSTPALYQSDPLPLPTSNYLENGAAMSYVFSPAPLPDTGELAQNVMLDMTWAMQLPNLGATDAGQAVWDQSLWDQGLWDGAPPTTITAFDISGLFLDKTVINPVAPLAAVWDQAVWDQSAWDQSGAIFQQLDVEWNGPLNFKQVVLQITGQCAPGLRIGNGYMRYQVLGYRLQLP